MLFRSVKRGHFSLLSLLFYTILPISVLSCSTLNVKNRLKKVDFGKKLHIKRGKTASFAHLWSCFLPFTSCRHRANQNRTSATQLKKMPRTRDSFRQIAAIIETFRIDNHSIIGGNPDSANGTVAVSIKGVGQAQDSRQELRERALFGPQPAKTVLGLIRQRTAVVSRDEGNQLLVLPGPGERPIDFSDQLLRALAMPLPAL